MSQKIRTVAELGAFLQSKAETYASMHSDYTTALAKDAETNTVAHSQHWLAWHATALLGAATEALQAEVLRSFMLEAPGSDEEFLLSTRKHAIRKICNLKPRVDSRSTLLASNLAEDHEHAFWCELLEKLTPYDEM